MSDPNQAPAVEVEAAGVFERLEAAFRNSRVGQLATVAVASLGVASAAEAYTAEPVGAENVPAHASSYEPQPSEQECVRAGTARPSFPVKPVMWHAGIRLGDPRHVPYQLVRGTIALPAMPDGCAPRYERIMSGKLWMQDRYNLSRWKRPILGNQPGHAGNTSLNSTFIEFNPSAWPDLAYNTCINDGRWLKVKYTLDMQVRDETNRDTVGEHTYTVPVPVRGSCKSAAVSARWAAKAWAENAR